MQGPSRAQMERPCRPHPGPRWSAHAGPVQGPGQTPPDTDTDTDELSDPNQGPSRVQMERPWRAHPGPRWSALAGPIQSPWRPEADQLEAEGRPNGGLGAKPQEKKHIEKTREGPTKYSHRRSGLVISEREKERERERKRENMSSTAKACSIFPPLTSWVTIRKTYEN